MSEEQKKEEKKEEAVASADNNKLCAILSYLLIGIIWYFGDAKIKKDEFAKFHVKQAIVLLVLSLGANIILGIIPVLGWIFMPFLNLLILILAIIGIINASNNKKKALPYIGQYSNKLKF